MSMIRIGSFVEGSSVDTFRISQSFSPATVKRASLFSPRMGVQVVDVVVGVYPRGLIVEMETLTLTIPMSRLLNGRKVGCIRTCRFNHLLNICTTWAEQTQGVNLSTHDVVFLGLGTLG